MWYVGTKTLLGIDLYFCNTAMDRGVDKLY